MAPLYFGNSLVRKVYLGTQEVKKIYRGTTLVYSSVLDSFDETLVNAWSMTFATSIPLADFVGRHWQTEVRCNVFVNITTKTPTFIMDALLDGKSGSMTFSNIQLTFPATGDSDITESWAQTSLQLGYSTGITAAMASKSITGMSLRTGTGIKSFSGTIQCKWTLT